MTAFDLFTYCTFFRPMRSQLETVLVFLLVNVCMKECELIKGGHTSRLLAAAESFSSTTKSSN